VVEAFLGGKEVGLIVAESAIEVYCLDDFR